MGCGCFGDIAISETENLNVAIIHQEEILFRLLSDYIKLHQNIYNNDDNKKLYIAQTDFFKTYSNILSKFLKKGNFDPGELKEEITNSKKLEVKKQDIKIIGHKDELINKNIEIEILNEEILNFFRIQKKIYRNKDVSYKILQDKIFEIIFHDKSKIYIQEINNSFHIISSNKINDIVDKNNSQFIVNKEKKLDKQNNLIEILENYPEKLHNEDTKSTQNRLNFNQSLLSEANDNFYQFTMIGKSIDNPIVEENNNELKSKYQSFLCYYKELFEELDNIDKSLNNKIDTIRYSNEYVIINKMYFNKLTKLFESNDKFINESDIIDSYNKLTKIDNLHININKFNERMNDFMKNPGFFELKNKTVENKKLKYPEKFVLIKEDLLLKFGIDKRYIKNNKFQILLGENYLFLKNNNNIFVCSKENIFFNVNIIFRGIENNYFENEVIKKIQNKRGFNYFFDEIEFDISKNSSYINENKKNKFDEIIIINYKKNISEFIKQISKNHIDEDNVISLFLKFIINSKSNLNKKIDDNIINEILEKIRKKNLNNFKDLIKIILNDMHKSLNTKNIGNDDCNEEGNDKNYIYEVFKINYNSHNESIIQYLYFGITLKTIIPLCNCKEKNYRCELSQYIYLNYDDIKNYDKLEDILENWGISKINNYHCQRCYLDCEANVNKTFKEYPRILIIILNDDSNENKKEINLYSTLKVPKYIYKYKLQIVISSKNKENDFCIIKKENKQWILLHNNKKCIKENFNGIKNWIKYPRVIFYERIEESGVKLDETQTEIELNNYFEQSVVTGPLNNNTRINNSLKYSELVSRNDEQRDELFISFKKPEKNYSNNNISKLKLNKSTNIGNKNIENNSFNLLNSGIEINKSLIKDDKSENLTNRMVSDINNISKKKDNIKINFRNQFSIQSDEKLSNGYSIKDIDTNMVLPAIKDKIFFNNMKQNSNSINSIENNDDNFININNNLLLNNNNNLPKLLNKNFNDNNLNKNNNIINNYNNCNNIIFNNSNINNNFKIYNLNINNIYPNYNQNQNLKSEFNDKLKENNQPKNDSNIGKNNNVENYFKLIQNNLDNNNNTINLVFTFDIGRKCFLTLNNGNIPFRNVIEILFNKYPWIGEKNLKKIYFLHGGRMLNDFSKTIQQYNIKNNDTILVFESD